MQDRRSYNVTVSFPAGEPNDEPAEPTARPANRQRDLARLGRVGLLVAAIIGIGLLAAACGGGSSGSGIASLGTTTTTTVSTAAGPKNSTEAQGDALRYIDCMRTHGEPNMPEPSFSGKHINININASSGVNPNSSQFTAASNACKHLLPKGGVPKGITITSADQADYLKGAACMRSHGVPNFPDPTFQNNGVEFNTQSSINANSPQYKSALATCEKLIPAGLPYSSSSAS
jgi:hypothetical protein